MTGGTFAVSAVTGSIRPKPYCGSRPGGPASRAVRMILLITFAASRFGYFDRINAATPETIAVESEVPSPQP